LEGGQDLGARYGESGKAGNPGSTRQLNKRYFVFIEKD
jgi:hypothetical protein